MNPDTDMIALTLGRECPIPLPPGEGAVVHLDENGLTVFIKFTPQNRRETELLTRLDPMKLGIFHFSDLAFLLIELGNTELRFDCPVHIGWMPKNRWPDLREYDQPGIHWLISIVSVDPATNTIRGLKSCTMSTRVTARLVGLLWMQTKTAPITQADYAHTLEAAYKKYPDSSAMFAHPRTLIDKAGS